jgi:hypothetical protein
MTVSLSNRAPETPLRHRYLREPVPLVFPESEEVGETGEHRYAMILLERIVRHALGDRALVCADQFLYFDPTNPKRCLAPDLALRVGAPNEIIGSWKTWQRGAPQIGVELESDWDREPVLAVKLERYREAGVEEVVCFDPRPVPPTLRIWDLIEGDLVERDPSQPEAQRCDALGLYWCIVPDAKVGYVLRLAEGPNGERLLPTPEEAARAREQDALRRVAELEAELSRRGS